jgi:hypothetical protein
MRLAQGFVAAVLVLGLIGCGGRTPSNNVQDDGGIITDGPYLLDDAGNIIYDDGGNPIPVPQDAAPGQDDGPHPNQDAPVAQQDSGSTPGVIQCGQTTCDADTQKCCISGGGGGGTATCIDATAQCQGATIACDGPEDCPTGTPQCCATYGGGGGGVTCTDNCQGLLLCRLDTDCDSGDRCCGNGEIRNMSASWCMAEAQCPNTNPTAGVPCGNDTCNDPDVCCVTMQGASCTQDCQNGLSLACDGPEDCSNGDICCGDVGMGGGGAECMAVDQCDPGWTSGVVCHADGDCPDNGTCTDIPMAPVRICR